MEIILHHKTLSLKQSFETSHGAVDERNSIILEIRYEIWSGFGEVVEIIYYGKSIKRLAQSLLSFEAHVKDLLPDDIPDFLDRLQQMSSDPFVKCAVDCALLDLYTKMRRLTIRDYFEIPFGSSICSTLTIGINTPLASAQFVTDNPWPIYKIKLGSTKDKQVIEHIRSVTDVPLIVDANSGWDLKTAIQMSQWLKQHGVLFIEQPLPAQNKDEIKHLYKESMLPIIADESCQTIEDLGFCLENYDGINIKIMKCGGISPALQMVTQARHAKKTVMVGCMTESSIGISAASQIAPLVDFCDLDGALLISNDPAIGVKIKNGLIIYADDFGHGGMLNLKE